MRRFAAVLVLIAGASAVLSGCSDDAQNAKAPTAAAASTTDASSTSSESSKEGTSPIDRCRRAHEYIAGARLDVAEAELAALGKQDPAVTCAPDASGLLKERRKEAADLVAAALSHPESASSFVAAALRIDADNRQAQALWRGSAAPSSMITSVSASATLPEPLPGLPQPPGHTTGTITTTPASDPCATARGALKSGELSRAEALVEAVDSKAECVVEVKREIKEKRAEDWPERARLHLADAANLLLLLGLAFVAGAMVGSALSVRIGPLVDRWASGIVTFLGWTFFAATGVAAVTHLLSIGRDATTACLWGLPVAVACSLVWGAALAFRVSDRAPIRVQVVNAGPGQGAGPTDASAKAMSGLVVAEVAQMSSVAPGGLSSVVGGSDVTGDMASAVSDLITDPRAKALTTAWKTLTGQLGDRVELQLLGEPLAAALVSYRRGRRVLHEVRLELSSVHVDKDHPSDREKASADRDLATLIAAEVVLIRLRRHPTPGRGPGPDRLYGATVPLSLACCSVAARHQDANKPTDALALYTRAVIADPKNKAARFGQAVVTCQLDPEEAHGGGEAKGQLIDLVDTLGSSHVCRHCRRPNPAGDRCTCAFLGLPLVWRAQFAVAAHLVNHQPAHIAEPDALLLSYLKSLCRPKKVRRVDQPLRAALRREALLISAISGSEGGLLSALETAGKDAPGVNAVSAFAALARPRHPWPNNLETKRFIRAARQIGADPDTRRGIIDDPIVRQVTSNDDWNALRASWEPPSYGDIHSMSAYAATLHAHYPDASVLLAEIIIDPDDVSRKSLAPVLVVNDVWPGALQWLAAGRPASLINLYQAAGIMSAVVASNMTPAEVEVALSAVRAFHDEISLPTSSERAQMAAVPVG